MKKAILTALVGFIILGLYIVTNINSNNRSKTFQSLNKLKSLPYITWSKVSSEDYNKSWVVYHDKTKAFPGINVYFTEVKWGGQLLDMEGNVMHRFMDKRDDKPNTKRKAQLLEIINSKNYLMMHLSYSIFKFDFNSNLIWETKGRFHHDIALKDNGDVLVLQMNTVKDRRYYDGQRKICNNSIVFLTSKGQEKKKLSFADLIYKNKQCYERFKKQKLIYLKHKILKNKNKEVDLFHTNSIEIADKDVYKKFLFWKKKVIKKGDIIFCMRYLNVIGAIDPRKEKITWCWGWNDLQGPHHPSLLDNGNILIFDNGVLRKYSRVIEYSITDERIVWEYTATPNKKMFFSKTRGSAQRLPNGNTLICESDKGHVFEVTKEGELVWDFWSPDLQETKDGGKKRGTIYRFYRIVDPKRIDEIKNKK